MVFEAVFPFGMRLWMALAGERNSVEARRVCCAQDLVVTSVCVVKCLWAEHTLILGPPNQAMVSQSVPVLVLFSARYQCHQCRSSRGGTKTDGIILLSYHGP
jgi:hypothetical protein